MKARPIITFTTDFGTPDHYVGTMKGAVLEICPDATLVDICHDVDSYDVLGGALTIAQAWPYFPAGTIHVIVVDPGVGSVRRPIVAECGRSIFVCPDNGVLSFIYEREHPATVRHVTNDRYFRHPVSNTFHGRDIFAPVAAHIALSVPLDNFGPEVTDYVTLKPPAPAYIGDGILEGQVLKIDKFGNVVTNIRAVDLENAVRIVSALRVTIGSRAITDLRTSYAGAPSGQLFAIFGSMGYLEIAINQSSAAAVLQIEPGTTLRVSVD